MGASLSPGGGRGHRRFRNGGGSHALTMRGIRKLQDHTIPIHAIAVLTSAAMEDPERMYTFFRDNGIHDLGFNVEEQEGVNATSSMQGVSREKQYHHFLKCFWECNQRDGFPIRLKYNGGRKSECCLCGCEWKYWNAIMRCYSCSQRG